MYIFPYYRGPRLLRVALMALPIPSGAGPYSVVILYNIRSVLAI